MNINDLGLPKMAESDFYLVVNASNGMPMTFYPEYQSFCESVPGTVCREIDYGEIYDREKLIEYLKIHRGTKDDDFNHLYLQVVPCRINAKTTNKVKA